MKNKVFFLTVFLFCIFSPINVFAEQIKYNFSKGAVYTYQYSKQDSSSVSAPIIAPRKKSDKQSIEFVIKSVGFQDNAFILDIGNKDATVRRYITSNGLLKGTPSEDRSSLPFFPSFPEGDWRIGTASKQSTEIYAFGKKIPVIWILNLKKINSINNLAYITFEANFNIAEDRFFSRSIVLNGNIIFNMAEGVIHQADWKSSYTAKQICKENSVTRNLWTFEKQSIHSLKMTGVEK